MNRAYRIVWNAVTATWNVASELTKGRKASKGSAAKSITVASAIASLVIVTGSFAMTAAEAAPANSYAVGILDQNGGKQTCFSSMTPGAIDTSTADCNSGAGNTQAAMVAYDSNGNWGSYVTLSDPSKVRIGAGNADKLVIKSDGIDAYDQLRMNNKNITGLSSGQVSATSTDAVNGSQLYATNANVTNLTSTVNNLNSATGLHYFKTAGNNDGTDDAKVGSYGSIAIGPNASAQSSGYQTVDAIAIGHSAYAPYGGDIALGGNAVAGGGNSVAIGTSASTLNAAANNQVALGGSAKSGAGDATAIGGFASAMTAGAVALGYNTVADRAAGAGGSTAAALSIGSGGSGTATTTRQIISVARGTQDTDAVNVSQLKGVTTALGGGAAVNADGTIKAPTYTVQGQTKSDVGSALAAIDTATTGNTTSISNLSNTVNNITNGTVGLVQQDATTKAITVAKATDGTTVDFTGTAGARQLKGVAAGKADTDAVNMSQLKSAGLNVDTSGNVTNAFVAYDDAAKGKITLAGASGTTIANVKAGNLSATSTDAVNGAQLYATNQNVAQNTGDISTLNTKITQINGEMSDAVKYDSSAHDKATLSGVSGTTITNVKAGAVSATSTDAVNGSQLYATNANVTNLTNTVNNITNGTVGLVQQDAATKAITVAKTTDGTTVDFTGTAGARQLKGIAAGKADTDAVNMSQLKSAGLNVDTSGNVTNAFVAYDDAAKGKITLAGASGTTIANVKAGNLSAASTDAVNGAQLYATNQNVAQNTGDISTLNTKITQINGEMSDAVKYDSSAHDKVTLLGVSGTTITNLKAGAVNATSTDAVNGSQLYGVSSSVANAIGGGATVNADGTISAPSYVVDGKTVSNMGDAITNIDERTTTNSTAINNINDTLDSITNSGAGIKYFHANSILADSQAIGLDAVAIGGNARAQADNSVALGANSVANRANSVSVGAAGAERQITNVAAGTADTDAVNLGQLKAAGLINTDGTANAASTYDHNADGSVNYSSMTMGNNVDGGTVIHNVAAGTEGKDAVNVDQMNAAISNVTTIANNANNPHFAANGSRETEAAVAGGNHATAMGANAKASADNSVALGANSVADRANTVSVGAAGSERQIANVAAGTQATDAVNVEQMNAAVNDAIGSMPAGMTAKDYTDSRVNSLQSTVNQVAKNSYAGIAAAMAMPNLTPSQPGKTVVAAGSGAYKSGAAAAVGVTHRSANGKWLANGAVSVTSTGDAGARVQVGYEF